MMALKPKSSSAHGACSRELPQPKLARVSNTSALVARLVQDEIGILRTQRAILPGLADIHVTPLVESVRAEPGTLDRLQNCLGMIASVSTLLRRAVRPDLPDERIFPLIHHLLYGLATLLEGATDHFTSFVQRTTHRLAALSAGLLASFSAPIATSFLTPLRGIAADDQNRHRSSGQNVRQPLLRERRAHRQNARRSQPPQPLPD